ncbi:MAG: 50S ribosomal protein L3 [Candidatus Taylorbacteria bacterium RIFCSPHIGHO2_01_FULL_51_15]|uniref:Large ribosomal subunit protein uL3 n=1 Tax=Candidatus Taylorbacteria bacterium RIFCSPHIGHO2_01_FULL_51_15 TaxID=1802304 RepID=A0A1G2MET0_9BACT|nr:MAG: 50S ribosomal protein L3 [Candidatus Taylorbacteria bacterium RIFCSPHIGHO2_01_FULL_51_15]
MKFLLGTKVNMTQVWDEQGHVRPVTVILVKPNVITQIRTVEKDGYSAVQVGWGTRKAKNVNKAMKGHVKDLGSFAGLREWRLEAPATEAVGDKIGVDVFKKGDEVTVSGVSKGKGFQGVVKRHGFKGGSRTHGQKHSEREPGAIGGGARAGGRVAKGMRMAGRMGGERVTVKNLKIIDIVPEEHLLLIGGAVPGRRGTVLEIQGS